MSPEPFRIESIQAFISVAEDGDEGIIGRMTGMGWVPFIAADADRLASLKPQAIAIAKATGIEVKLVRFSLREDVETIVP